MRGSSCFILAITGREASGRALLCALGQESMLIMKGIVPFLPKAGWKGSWEKRLAKASILVGWEYLRRGALGPHKGLLLP